MNRQPLSMGLSAGRQEGRGGRREAGGEEGIGREGRINEDDKRNKKEEEQRGGEAQAISSSIVHVRMYVCMYKEQVYSVYRHTYALHVA